MSCIVSSSSLCGVRAAPFYGRSPKDRYVVENEPSKNHVDWGDINVPMAPEVFDEL